MQVREQRRRQLRRTVQRHAHFANVRRHLLDEARLAQCGRRGGRPIDGQAGHRTGAGAQRHNRDGAEDEHDAGGDCGGGGGGGGRLHRDGDYWWLLRVF